MKHMWGRERMNGYIDITVGKDCPCFMSFNISGEIKLRGVLDKLGTLS